ncbi:MAG TPA: hypothetical protein ENL00_01665, partial [Nitratifractor sp.]|nr:hypothetical protein [Nitratifractor sp.]
EYAAVIEIDMNEITEPILACPNDPDDVATLSEILADDKRPNNIDEVFVGVLKEMKPSDFKDIVSSPGGTTIAGVATLENRAVRAAFIEAMASCYDRALELGKKE